MEEIFTGKIMKPYTDENIDDNTFIRTFSGINKDDLVWHRDKKDRLIKVIDGSDWTIQFDNMMPFPLKVGDYITIPRNIFHRLIIGTTDLKLLIMES